MKKECKRNNIWTRETIFRVQDNENPVWVQENENPVWVQENENPVWVQENENPWWVQENENPGCVQENIWNPATQANTVHMPSLASEINDKFMMVCRRLLLYYLEILRACELWTLDDTAHVRTYSVTHAWIYTAEQSACWIRILRWVSFYLQKRSAWRADLVLLRICKILCCAGWINSTAHS